MSKNIHIYTAAALAALPLLTQTSAAAPKAQQQPNVLIVLGDDIGYGDFSFHGGATPTPRIDALASQGVELTNFMVHSLSSPTRAMLMTGRHFLRTNQGPVTDGSLDPAEMTIARMFQQGGYATGIFGKWHNSYDPQTPEFVKYLEERGKKSRQKSVCVLEYGFDTSWNYYGGGSDYYTRDTKEGFNTWWNGYKHMPQEQGWTEDLITGHAMDFMASSQKQGKPFFCYVACELLHAPFQPLWEDYIQVPDELIPTRGRLSKDEFERITHLDNTPASGWDKEDIRSIYAAMIVAHNRNLGKLMDFLDSKGLDKNTIVVYFTDNGATPQGSNAPFKGGKHTLWEGGVHVPCMIRWPGQIAPGTKWEGLGGVMEMMPTLAAMTGVKIPEETKPLDGKNIWPALRSGGKSPVEDYYWTLNYDDALRTADWKARRVYDGVELYDIRNDVGETKDVAGENPAVVKDMVARMERWISSTGAQITHLPTRKDVGAAAPGGQVLEISVKLARDVKKREDLLMVPFASWDDDHRSQDLLVVDMMVPQGSQAKGYRITPLDLCSGMGNVYVFNAPAAVDQFGTLAWEGVMPRGGYGVWERRAYGLSRNTPHDFRNFAMVLGGAKGDYTVYIDNLFILHADGSRTALWESGADEYDMEKYLRAPDGYMPDSIDPAKLTTIPGGYTGLTVRAVGLDKVRK